MSHRPINEKRAARMRKAITRKPLPKFVDPVKWLRVRGYASTAGAARKIILDERLKIDSHPVGITEITVRNEDGTTAKQRAVTNVATEGTERMQVTA